MTDTTELFDRPPTPARQGGRRDNRPPFSDLIVLAAGVLISAIVLIVVVLALFGDDDSSIDTTDTSTTVTTTETSTTGSTSTATTASTSTESVTTSSASTTSTVDTTTSSSATTASTAQTTTTVEDPDTYRSAVWPRPDSGTRYTDPVAAAQDFAVDYIGFADPVVGVFQAGDARSGEVEVRPTADGPVTFVIVRLLGSDDTWWVLGAATDNITLSEPPAMSEIESPLTVAGTALAFEGQVDIALRADGIDQPLVETFATGGGDQAQPFETTIEWSDPDVDGGALVLTTSGGGNGSVWEASVTRVFFEER